MKITSKKKIMNKIEMDRINGTIRVDKSITLSEMNAICRKIKKELEEMAYIPEVAMHLNEDLLLLEIEFYNPFGERFGSIMFISSEDLNKCCYVLDDVVNDLEDEIRFTFEEWAEYCDRTIDNIASILNGDYSKDEEN